MNIPGGRAASRPAVALPAAGRGLPSSRLQAPSTCAKEANGVSLALGNAVLTANARMRITNPVGAGPSASRESRTAGSRPEALRLLRDRYQTEWTWSACGPLMPGLTVYSTFWFSSSGWAGWLVSRCQKYGPTLVWHRPC
jgi:hypothetical protein